MPPVKDIELKSEEVQDILTAPPKWIISWGITVILGIFILFGTACWFIKYPDTIKTRVLITTKLPPVRVVAKASGKLQLLASDRQDIETNQYIGIIENPAKTEDILHLLKTMQSHSYHTVLEDSSIKAYLGKPLHLGEVQNSYFILQKSLHEYYMLTSLKPYIKQMNNIITKLNKYQKLGVQLERQKVIAQEEYNIGQKKYNVDSLLYRQKVISDVEFQNTRSSFLRIAAGLENAEATIINNAINIAQLEAQLSEIDDIQFQELAQHKNNIIESFQQLESDLKRWQQQYLIIAPFKGSLAFSKYWSNNQHVIAGEEIATIIPDSRHIYGQVLMSASGSGKVAVGNKVLIQLDQYPYNEFGVITGQVSSISLVPKDGFYRVDLILPNGLISSYNKPLEFKQEMEGNADIINQDIRILERIFYQLRPIINKI